MKVAITGGAGFIGHHLAALLLSEGHSVTVLDNLRRASFERPELRGARLVEGDIRCASDCECAFTGADAVVHLAAQSNVMGSQSDPDYTMATNVTGTWTAALAAAESGVQHFVFASSREVYGEAEALPVKESAPMRPANLYGATKAAGETLLRHAPLGDMGVSILRFSNVIGRGDSGRVVPLWLQNARSGLPLTVFGGTQTMDLVPVSFACEAVGAVLGHGPVCGPLNIGSGTATPILDLAKHLITLTRSTSAIEVAPPRGPEVMRFQADTAALRAVLGLEPPQHPLESIEADW